MHFKSSCSTSSSSWKHMNETEKQRNGGELFVHGSRFLCLEGLTFCYSSRPQIILIRVPKLCRSVYIWLKRSLFEFNPVQWRSVVAKFWFTSNLGEINPLDTLSSDLELPLWKDSSSRQWLADNLDHIQNVTLRFVFILKVFAQHPTYGRLLCSRLSCYFPMQWSAISTPKRLWVWPSVNLACKIARRKKKKTLIFTEVF